MQQFLNYISDSLWTTMGRRRSCALTWSASSSPEEEGNILLRYCMLLFRKWEELLPSNKDGRSFMAQDKPSFHCKVIRSNTGELLEKIQKTKLFRTVIVFTEPRCIASFLGIFGCRWKKANGLHPAFESTSEQPSNHPWFQNSP